MDLLHIFFTSIGSIIVLFLLTKLMGYRQMSQLSMFDYINGITIGSIAAEMAISLENDFLKPLIAMVVYGLTSLLFSKLSEKSVIMRRFLVGKSALLFDNDCLYFKNLKKAHLDLAEFLSQCRVNGYFDLSQIQTAVLEPTGRISFLPKSSYRPLTPNDLHLNLTPEMPVATVIVDGNIMKENLKHTGRNEKWLRQQVSDLGFTDIKTVALALCTMDGKVHVYNKYPKKPDHDILN